MNQLMPEFTARRVDTASSRTVLRLALLGLLTLVYPFAVYLGLAHFEPRYLAGFLAAIALLRAAATRERVWLAAACGALVLAAISSLANTATPLKLYPALINSIFLLVFLTSLRYPPTVIERIARLREPDLPPAGVRYTRRVTQVWCGFFLLNGSIATVTAFYADRATWTLYNGFIAYLLMGTLFAIEWLVRRRIRVRDAAALPHG